MGKTAIIKSLVILGFPGTGKSKLYKQIKSRNLSDPLVDLGTDEYEYLDKERTIKNPEYPDNYAKKIIELQRRCPVIFASASPEVRRALQKNRIFYVLVHPNKDLKEVYLNRYREGNKPIEFINMMNDKWDELIDDCENDPMPKVKFNTPTLMFSIGLIKSINSRCQLIYSVTDNDVNATETQGLADKILQK